MAKQTKTLHLILKKKWFDMIASGEKKEEYREIKQHWETRLKWKEQALKPFDTVTFTNGYSKNSPRFEIELKEIIKGTGLEMWGAETGKEYFVIKLGELLKSELEGSNNG